MANTVNLSSQFENNLRRTSEVGVATFPAKVSINGDRLGQADEFAKAGDAYQVFTIPADSIATNIYIVVDEAFDTGAKATLKTIAGTPKVIKTDADLTVVGATVATLKNAYFAKTDGISAVFSADVTKGSFRVVAEFISCSNNNGTYVDMPSLTV